MVADQRYQLLTMHVPPSTTARAAALGAANPRKFTFTSAVVDQSWGESARAAQAAVKWRLFLALVGDRLAPMYTQPESHQRRGPFRHLARAAYYPETL